ncbi:MAG: FAD-dependent oxidoreductase [Planctomycetaceae bacterium]|nr:FAD-dependent oxidoreductase [Planctomycetaceae bacterium]
MASRWGRREFLRSAIATSMVSAVTGDVAESAQPKLVGSRAAVKDALRTQVLVVGAGASGVPAALAAARGGAKVVLLEDDNTPGGAPVDMYVAMVCGGPIVGIYAEMLELLNRNFHLTAKPTGGAWFLPSAYAEVISRMIRAEPNVQLRCSAPVSEVLISEGSRNRLHGVTVRGADGRQLTIEADVVIDATGSGAVAAMAGCECRYGSEAKSEFDEPTGPAKANDKIQLCTLMLVSQRLRPDGKIDPGKVTGQSCPAEGLNAALHWAGTVSCADTRDPLAVAAAQQEAMQKIEKDIAYLYEHGYTAHIAPKLGVRECRRVVGDHVLTVNDLIASKRADDTVALGNYPLDSWGDRYGAMEKTTLTYTPGGYGIPLRAMITKGMQNLMTVGKCMSATHLAMSAIRVQCIVAQMGQAAGTAAALAATKGTSLRSLKVRDVQAMLRAGGVPL